MEYPFALDISQLLIQSDDLLQRGREAITSCDRAARTLRVAMELSSTSCTEAGRLVERLATRKPLAPSYS
jgi:hypothetical protein